LLPLLCIPKQNKQLFIHSNFIKMKIGTYVANAQGNIDPQKVFRPLQTILIDIHGVGFTKASFLALAAKLNVTLINSQNGNQDSIIPFVPLNTLAEIATMHEGVVSIDDTHILIPVLLHPSANLSIDNNKYLDIEISGLTAGQTIDIYGFESQRMSDMICKYSKFSIPIGTSRQSISVGTNDFLALPITQFDSIRVTYATGVVADLSPRELAYMMAKENDMTLASNDGAQLILSYGKNFVLDLQGVKSFEVVRDTDSTSAYELVLGDLN
jgi:hypothetical protein